MDRAKSTSIFSDKISYNLVGTKLDPEDHIQEVIETQNYLC